MESMDGKATFYAQTREDWRAWLEANGATEKAVVLILYRPLSRTPSVHYEEAVEEALCYGWVDSKGLKRDAESTYLTFTPRNPRGTWSKSNRERVEKLTREGRMRPAGQAMVDLAKQTGTWDVLAEAQDLMIPVDLQGALDQNETARRNFQAFSDSSKRILLEWIAKAKRPETRQRRIERTVEQAAQNRKAFEG